MERKPIVERHAPRPWPGEPDGSGVHSDLPGTGPAGAPAPRPPVPTGGSGLRFPSQLAAKD